MTSPRTHDYSDSGRERGCVSTKRPVTSGKSSGTAFAEEARKRRNLTGARMPAFAVQTPSIIAEYTNFNQTMRVRITVACREFRTVVVYTTTE